MTVTDAMNEVVDDVLEDGDHPLWNRLNDLTLALGEPFLNRLSNYAKDHVAPLPYDEKTKIATGMLIGALFGIEYNRRGYTLPGMQA